MKIPMTPAMRDQISMLIPDAMNPETLWEIALLALIDANAHVALEDVISIMLLNKPDVRMGW